MRDSGPKARRTGEKGARVLRADGIGRPIPARIKRVGVPSSLSGGHEEDGPGKAYALRKGMANLDGGSEPPKTFG